MNLAPGTRLGPYELIGSVGSGGMGVVYRARDTRLDRTVAIKVLQPDVAADPSFALRFEREARIISALNHPRICALHDVGCEGDLKYLVLEYLEGESLATRLVRGALPLSQVLKYAIEVADALDAAHQRGIVHRDLKPGNIMLTPAGVKLVDFGLAHPAGPGAFAMSLETTHPMPSTAVGTFVGTLQYMAPEQIQGREADARTDIFALGTVIYEMATGKKTFEADTQASLVAKILETDAPSVSTFAPLAPSALNHVVDVCLAKQPSDRWQTAHDVLLQLRWIQQQGSRAGVASLTETKARTRRWLPWAAAAAVFIAMAMAGVAWGLGSGRADVNDITTRIDMAMPSTITLTRYGVPTLSPDGRMIVLSAYAKGVAQLFVRRMDDAAFVALPSTEGGRSPFWSPDSRSIAFVAGGKLRRVDIGGGPQTVLADAVPELGGSWSRDGVILFNHRVPGPLFRISASGGTPEPATTLDVGRHERGHAFPHFLPDGKTFLFAAAGPESGLFAGSLESPAVTRVVRDAMGQSAYLPSGQLLFVQQHTLLAAPFDVRQLQLSDAASVVARQVREGVFSASQNRTLVYRPGGEGLVQLSLAARDGRVVKAVGEPGPYRQFALSPTGRWIAIQQGNVLRVDADEDLWLLDMTTGIHSRLTTEPTFDGDPVWSPDEKTLAFTSRRRGRLEAYRRDMVTGAEEPLGKLQDPMVIDEWTPDGRFIVLRSVGGGAVYALPTSGDPTPKLLVDTPFIEDQSHVSPDGNWIAFNSDETGRWEVYVARFPSFAAKRQISSHGGMQPFWRNDGRELFYLSPDGTVMAVDARTAETFQPGVARALFKTKLTPAPGLSQYAVTANGQRFLVAEPLTNDDQTITFVLNWHLPAR